MIDCPYCGAPRDWLTPHEAAQLLNVDESRVRQMARAGRFPGSVRVEGIHKNGMWKIPVTAVLPMVQKEA